MVSYFIENPNIMTEVSDQKSQNCSLSLAVADMVTMVMKMSLKVPYLDLSPQPLIDSFEEDKRRKTPQYIHHFCTNVGIEDQTTYPFTRIPRDNFDESVYSTRTNPRYKLHDLVYTEDKTHIKELIVQNFGPDGKKFPIVVAMYLGEFADKEFARACEENSKPYRPSVSRKRGRKGEEEHALLVVGCDTTSTEASDHYCRVKNTIGKKWGKGGYSVVAFEAFFVG